ncbi:MAG: hypothetical protein Q4F57_05775 [Weeksellaceae bacterium]|nr:hypothetical protein [Weeksellaceae bacterium]
MKYFIINYTFNPKVRGCQNGTIKDYKYYGNIYDPKFIGRINFEKVDFDPIPVSPILYSKAKKTDLIDKGGQLSHRIVVSTKLKMILEKNDFGVQYFQNSIIHRNIEDFQYWVINPFENKNKWIDINNSSIYFRKFNPEKIENFKILNLSPIEFKSLLEVKNIFDEIYYYQLSLFEEMIDRDFFTLQTTIQGVSYIVSENLKQEIEEADCTGIEFQPIELSYQEWTAPGGERERVYGKM